MPIVAAPRRGTDAYGLIPGPIDVAPNVYSQIQGLYPNLTRTGTNAFGVVNSELNPSFNPELQNYAASLGWAQGMPGSQFSGVNNLRMERDYLDRQKTQGLRDFNSLLSTLAPTQTSPELATNVAERNATLAAAPDPRMDAMEQLRLWEQQYNKTNPAGGTGGPISINRGLPPAPTTFGQYAPSTAGAAGGGSGVSYPTYTPSPGMNSTTFWDNWMKQSQAAQNNPAGGTIAPSGVNPEDWDSFIAALEGWTTPGNLD
jgi:hypothetical protein